MVRFAALPGRSHDMIRLLSIGLLNMEDAVKIGLILAAIATMMFVLAYLLRHLPVRSRSSIRVRSGFFGSSLYPLMNGQESC